MFGWWRKRPPPPIPEALWQGVLRAYPFLARLPTSERDRLRELSARFLQEKEFHGANGLVITDEIALAIAAQAVLPVLHLGLSGYDDFVGIVVHPDEVVARRIQTDEAGVVHAYSEVLSGEAMERGPVMLTWSQVQPSDTHAQAGYNLVIHEFAHKLDMHNGGADGCPTLPRGLRRRWREVMQAEYRAFREKVILHERFGAEAPWLDAYGATDPGEFFAVACEAYFVNRERFAAEFPRLLELFDRFFVPGG
ncbi:zinc-dependent peptidase [Ramlibacter sp. AW1]|uniref:Zinc-dependent peptidase n=1 Tax=Ramlibacter aurantiacus TaxID=2801330 RepID=A0A936ZTU3_9BURK|nr:M90 family metallopeptidase [Ramlibacter aurantiacus]MBL0420494.1 zinc-dependent peptidase [Ramlibacter aurantiacus]